MLDQSVLDRFVESCPAAVMIRATLENLLPAISRTYYLALERRKGEMGQFMNVFASLLQAVIARDQVLIRSLLGDYGKHNCRLVLATLAER